MTDGSAVAYRGPANGKVIPGNMIRAGSFRFPKPTPVDWSAQPGTEPSLDTTIYQVHRVVDGQGRVWRVAVPAEDSVDLVASRTMPTGLKAVLFDLPAADWARVRDIETEARWREFERARREATQQ